MSELVGRFLSFEEHLGRGLVRFVYYVLLFLLVITTAWQLVITVTGLFDHFWANLWRLLVTEPLAFFVKLLLLRVGAELVIAILSIDDNLQGGTPEGDIMSSGLNPAQDRGKAEVSSMMVASKMAPRSPDKEPRDPPEDPKGSAADAPPEEKDLPPGS